MDTEKDNWQDSPQTGREANRENNSSSNPRKIVLRRSNSDKREEGEQRSYTSSRNSRGDDNRSYNRSYGNNQSGERRSYGNREYGDRSYGNRSNSDRSYSSNRPRYNNDGGYNRQSRYDNSNREGGWNNENSSGERRSFTPRYNREGGNSYGNRNDNRGDYSQRRSYSSRGEGFNRPNRRTDDYDPNAKYTKRKQMEYKQQFVDPTKPIRLNKYLANAGICSRREADELIESGSITVNGVVITELGTKVMRSDEVKVNDTVAKIEKKVYVLLNKPKDCVTTLDDPQERRTVMDFVRGACDERIYPVGRLDRKTTGVLLLTNDGDLASKLTHPKYEKKKIYHVCTDINITKNDLEKIAEGIELEDGVIKADSIGYIDEDKKNQVGIEIVCG